MADEIDIRLENPERQHAREINDYSNCWRYEDPQYCLVDGKTLSEIGVPLDLPISNEPLKPPCLSKLMATYEKSLGIVKVEDKITVENPWGSMFGEDKRYSTFESGRSYWEKTYGSIGVGLTNRLFQLLYQCKALQPEEDPAYILSKKKLLEFSPDVIKLIQNKINDYNVSLLDELYMWFKPEHRLKYQAEVEALTKQRLDVIATKLGIVLNKTDGLFPSIYKLYSAFILDIGKHTAQLTSEEKLRVEELLYSKDLKYGVECGGWLIPWGVITTDKWEWEGFRNGALEAHIYLPTNLPDYRGEGDFHTDAQMVMWRAAKRQVLAEYQHNDTQVPYPPNMESPSRVIIPYKSNGMIKNLGIVFFNNISRVSPTILDEVRHIFKRVYDCDNVVFIAPTISGKNQVVIPLYSDTKAVDFLMAVKTRPEKTKTIQLGQISTGISG